MATDWDSVVGQWAASNPQASQPGAMPSADPDAGPVEMQGAEPPPAPASAGPDEPANPWDTAVDQFHSMRVQASQAALYASRGTAPDKAGQALNLSQQTGAPFPAVLNDLPGYQGQAQAASNAAVLKADPVLADWLAQNPVAPAVVADDLANLSTTGRLWREVTGGWSQGMAGNELGRRYFAGQSTQDTPAVADLERSMQAAGSLDSGPVHWIASQVGALADTLGHSISLGLAGSVAGGGIGALATGVPTGGLAAPVGALAGAGIGGAAGFGAGMFTDAFKIGFGNTLHSLGQVTDANGNRLSAPAQLGAATVAGLVGGALNIIGMGAPAKALLSPLVEQAVSQAVARPTVASAFGNLAGGLAREATMGAVKGAGFGALQGVAQVASEQAARMASAGDFQTVLNDPDQRAQAVSEIERSIAGMAVMMGGLHAAGPLGKLPGDLLNARRASGDAAAFQSLEAGAAGSATRTRAPSVFQDWMERQNPDGAGADNLYVPAQRVADLYQRYGIEPDGNDGLLGPVAPDIRDQLAQGLPSGGDVVLPMSSYLTHLAGSDVSRELQPDLRTRQDGMSLNDAAQFQAAHQEAVQQAGAAADQQTVGQPATSRDAISDDVFSQARQAGFTNDASRQYAALFAARFATRGARLGVDPMDLYREEGLSIRSADQQQSAPAAAPDNLDVLINAMRSGRAEPSDADLQGPSLMQFLARRGGVVDQGGELSSVGADTWHRGKPGQRRFIRPPDDAADAGAALPGFEGTRAASSEFGLEGAAEAAHEAGYLPDAEPDTLVDAVRQEVGGEPVRSQRNTDQRRADFRAATDDLRETLSRQGIDPATATNAEIRRALGHNDRAASVEGQKPQGTSLSSISDATMATVTSDLGSQIARTPDGATHLRLTVTPAELAELRGGGVAISDNGVMTLAEAMRLEAGRNRFDGPTATPSGTSPGTGGPTDRGPLTTLKGLLARSEARDATWPDQPPSSKTIALRAQVAKLEARFAASDAISSAPDDGVDLHASKAAPIEDGREFEQRVYHGSPHIFDRFDTSAIGTGEGAQAYGHGLYFASNKAVAAYYRKVLTERVTQGDIEARGLLARIPGTVEEKRAELESRLTRSRADNPQDAEQRDFEGKIAQAKALLDRGDGGNGRLYHVEIPDDGEYLDWDRPLSEQPQRVRETLATHLDTAERQKTEEYAGFTLHTLNDAKGDRIGSVREEDGRFTAYRPGQDGAIGTFDNLAAAMDAVRGSREMLGRDAYQLLAEKLSRVADAEPDHQASPPGWGAIEPERYSDPVAASKVLQDAGVPGIRYLDAGSRGTAADGASHNYVVFHGDDAAIREYEQSVQPVARITGEEIAPRTADLKALRAAARTFYDEKLRGTSVRSDALGADVEFRSSRKAFNTSAQADKLRLFAALPDMIRDGTLESSQPPYDPAREANVKAYHTLAATVEIDGKPVDVRLTIREDDKGHLWYDHVLSDNREGGTPVEGSAVTRRKGGTIPDDGSTFEQGSAAADGVNMTLGQPDGSAGIPPASDVRGSIRLSDGQQLIRLFAKRDMSTLLHEAGHGWLDEMTRDAARLDAPQQIRDDMAAIVKWLGVDHADQIGVDQHEQFARGIEAYLMTGNAPSEALAGAFGRFRAWLVRIYKSLSGLRVEMSPEIRDVMDRLVATDDEIAGARARQGLTGMFRDAGEAGMTDAEFAAYHGAVERARGEAQDGLTNRVMSDVRRQRTAEWREQEAPIRDDVTREVDARPAERALRLIRTGQLDGEGTPRRMRLSRDSIVDMHGSDTALDLLPRSVPPVYAKEGGMHPDLMAQLLGMRSGDELVQSLMQHEAQRRALREQGDMRSPRQHAIDTETQARMVERHGDALADGSIEGEALDQVHNERQLEVLGTELAALARQSRKTATPTSLARSWAERTINDKQVGDGTKPNLYARAEAKAGALAMKALLAGDHAEAFKQKQSQLLNHALYLAAKAAKADVDRGQALFDRFGAKAEFPTIAPGYVDRVHDLMRRFEMPTKRDPAELDRGLGKVTLEQWATARIAEGHEISIAPDLYDGTYARPADTLTVSQFRDLAETVRSIAHVGRDERQVEVDGVKADRADVVAQMMTTMAGLRTRDVRDFDNQGGASGARGGLERAGQAAGAFHAMLLKPEAILDRLDGDDPNGVFNKSVWRPIKAAQALKGDLEAEMVGRMRDLREVVGKGYGKDWDRTLPDQPELTDQRTGQPMAMKKRGLIAIALNTGSESNFDRLTEGYGWTREGVQAALDRNMTAADWRYVQGTWDTFEALFPRIEAMQRRMTGVGLEKVEAREVSTAHGTFKGGYFPVVYDPNLSQLGDRIRAAGEQRFEADYVRATTPKGHTIARVDYVGEPLSLNPDIVHWKLGQAIHDLAYREAIVQADKLLGDRQVMGRMDETVGKAQRLQLDRWLQGIANAPNIDTRGLGAMDAFLHKLRLNSMVVGIGFRATTMLKHGVTALSNSIGELGPAWMLKGSTEFFGSVDKMRRNYGMITDKSAEMRQRFNAVDRDVRDALGDLSGKSSVLADAERFGHYGVATLDMLSALPTWLGAYRKALAGGMEEADAVAYGDKTVRNAHGAQGAPDLAAIQRGSEAQKLFTMFYGFFNHIYNRQVTGVRAAGSMVGNLRAGDYAGARTDFAKTLSTFFFYLAAPALIEGLVSTGGPSQDEDTLSWAAKQIAGEVPAGLPMLRDMAKAAIDGRGYEMSPVGHAVDEVVKGGRDLASAAGLSDKPVSDRWLQHAIEAPGYVLGLPTGQAAGSAQFLANVAGGQENPQTVADWFRGLVYGPAPKRPVH